MPPHRRPSPHAARALALALSTAILATPLGAQAGLSVPHPYRPPWADVAPTEVLTFDYNPSVPPNQNGFDLRIAIYGLTPGQRLEIGPGTYVIKPYFNVALRGTAQAPIWIAAQPGAKPVITRPDAAQNVVNVGVLPDGPTEYVVFENLEITGGSAGMRLYSVNNVWVDGCHIHHTGEAALTANTEDTDSVWITRNEIDHTAGQGEGMYLGGNNAAVIMSNSVIAQNHVHDTLGVQGDGIELKQGSWGNLIAENLVHDTQDPCILVYGTDGMPINRVLGNVLYKSADNTLQVQGEADVFNNLVMTAGGSGFFSFDHQGLTRDLRFQHNTVITTGRAGHFDSWNARPGMVLTNNVFYSLGGPSVDFPNGSQDVVIRKNFIVGPVIGTPNGDPFFLAGVGPSDFEDVTWNASARRAQPRPGSPLVDAGNPTIPIFFGVPRDLNGQTRQIPPDVGAFEEHSFGYHYGASLPGPQGELPEVAVDSVPSVGNVGFDIELRDGPPNELAVLVVGVVPIDIPFASGNLWVLPLFPPLTVVPTDATGAASMNLPIPPTLSLAGVEVFFQWLATGNWTPEGVAYSDGLRTVISIPGVGGGP